MTINATSAKFMLLHCHSQAICNALDIYTPINRQRHGNYSATIKADPTAAIGNINIYAIYDTPIQLTSSVALNDSVAYNIGTIYCGTSSIDWSHSCLISAMTSTCTVHSNGSQCVATLPETTHVPYKPSDANSDALLYTSIAMSLIILLLCVAMVVIYHKTKDQYSGRLKPKSSSYDYDPAFGYNLRQQTGDSVDNAHAMSNVHASAANTNDYEENGRASLSNNYKFAPSGAQSLSAISFSARNDIANHFLNTTAGSLTLDSNIVRSTRESFTTTTKKLNDDSNVELELAERQKPKFSMSAVPAIEVINEDHSTDFPNRMTVTDSDDAKRTSDAPVPEQHSQQNEHMEATDEDEEPEQVLTEIPYHEQVRHMIVISSSEQTLVQYGSTDTPRTPNTPHHGDGEHKEEDGNAANAELENDGDVNGNVSE
eukprot:CAMPEP_0202729614 /NCGR_PEP_ID=MMETSP1385-20130828/186223_1 /ASSEMBLY_ACC=CAM_ASM_000861 /TAXON_ID=933848 /ORGANISM="Elphidium margaritaceum" /LENGTH=427 /DNA_ID=CAMNT_0049395881 /DNA_START=216 /DNA_END=1499 /DNA_ORIENTATION=+